MITAEGKTIYHAGDTDFIPEMRRLGHVDIALLPSGDTNTMDNSEVADAAVAISLTPWFRCIVGIPTPRSSKLRLKPDQGCTNETRRRIQVLLLPI